MVVRCAACSPKKRDNAKISVWHGDLSEEYLRYVTQLGIDCLDCGTGNYFPGLDEQGYPGLDELLKIKKKVRSWGLDFNRVTLPDITDKFMLRVGPSPKRAPRKDPHLSRPEGTSHSEALHPHPHRLTCPPKRPFIFPIHSLPLDLLRVLVSSW